MHRKQKEQQTGRLTGWHEQKNQQKRWYSGAKLSVFVCTAYDLCYCYYQFSYFPHCFCSFLLFVFVLCDTMPIVWCWLLRLFAFCCFATMWWFLFSFGFCLFRDIVQLIKKVCSHNLFAWTHHQQTITTTTIKWTTKNVVEESKSKQKRSYKYLKTYYIFITRSAFQMCGINIHKCVVSCCI